MRDCMCVCVCIRGSLIPNPSSSASSLSCVCGRTVSMTAKCSECDVFQRKTEATDCFCVNGHMMCTFHLTLLVYRPSVSRISPPPPPSLFSVLPLGSAAVPSPKDSPHSLCVCVGEWSGFYVAKGPWLLYRVTKVRREVIRVNGVCSYSFSS